MLDRLEESGYRLTEPRRRVLETLRASGEPLTAQDVAGRAGTSVASTYRVLALLAELGVVSELPDEAGEAQGEPRGKRYGLCAMSEHHHHFVCRSCHTALEITCDAVERALREVEAATGIVLESHQLLLRGRCPRCRNGEGEA